MKCPRKTIVSMEEIARRGPLTSSQLSRLEKELVSKGNYSLERIHRELGWFCLELGIDAYYFRHTPIAEIARHIESLRASRIISENSGGEPVAIQVFNEEGASAFYMVQDEPDQVCRAKRRIEANYPIFRVESYLSRGYPLRLFNVSVPIFPRKALPGDFFSAASRKFISKSPPETIERYRQLWEEFQERRMPLVRFSRREDTGETRVMLAVARASSAGVFSAIDFVFKSFGLAVRREYVEPFADGCVIYSIYTRKGVGSGKKDRLGRELSAAVLLPEGPLSELFFSGKLGAEETAYIAAAAAFAHQFLTTHTEEYSSLSAALAGQPEMLGLLGIFKTHLAKDTYHEARIESVIFNHPEITRALFGAFHARFVPERKRRDFQKRQQAAVDMIRTDVSNEIARHILEIMVVFNASILKTNFFREDKDSLAFRLEADFLNPVDYPAKPWGIFYILGKGFRGFHIRFREIARGGIRFVRSPTTVDYDLNSDFIFEENYNLALTQQRKNKDIPEGGAKGTILPGPGLESRRAIFFRRYVDGLLDLILPHPRVVDYLSDEEILFLGPDEGTADLMDWAAEHARKRGYRYWRAFTTGKSPALGGIPHDTFGMTTHGVRQYVEDIISKKGLNQQEITKFQTGGPDGDLGSNEILLSEEKIVALADGSGVLCDPSGLNRKELTRLARLRLPATAYRRERFSKDGFFVGINDRDITLPDGTRVANGTEFRDSFHFYPDLRADLFVPCGGRPKAININNWRQFLDDDREPRAGIIVEGANLFITQEARLRLEEAGAVIIKDASANKGGVTSSSLEVLASLVLPDREYRRLMTVDPGKKPSGFRSRYIAEIIKHIRSNAHLEFKILWKAHQATGEPFSILSDRLSDKINRTTDLISESSLMRRRLLMLKVIESHCPKPLLRKYSPREIASRLPASYRCAFFAASLASDYVYRRGLETDELDFIEFVETYARK